MQLLAGAIVSDRRLVAERHSRAAPIYSIHGETGACRLSLALGIIGPAAPVAADADEIARIG